MASIIFYTGTMMSGKTTHLLQTHYNTENAFPGEVLLINRNDRSGESVCTNRMGGVSLSIGLTPDTSIIDLVSQYEKKHEQQIKHLFVDEAQFLSITQVDELAHMADIYDTNVYAYGLLTNYKGTLFPATQRILEIADKLIQIENGMRCWCGKQATHNALYLYDSKKAGQDEIIDNNSAVHYQVMCRKHFKEHLANTSNGQFRRKNAPSIVN